MLRKCWKIKKFENWGLLVGWGMGNERLYSIMIIIRSGFKKKYVIFWLVVEKVNAMKKRKKEYFELYSVF